MSGERMYKVNELLKKVLGEIISREVELPLGILATITKVDTARDLQNATVYISVLPDQKRISTLQSIQKTATFLQHKLGRKIKLKFTPRLHFTLDAGEIKAQKIYKIIDQQ